MQQSAATHLNGVVESEVLIGVCSKPENLTYAVPSSVKESYEEGDSVTYSCLPTYKYIPPLRNVSTCENTGTWSTFQEVFCKKLNCGIPDILENGEVEFLDTVIGSLASYSCMEGYIIFDSGSRYCLADERWNGTVASCRRTCPEPPNLQFAQINTTFSLNYYPQSLRVFYTCVSGFLPNTSLSSSTMCQIDFTWSKIIEFCFRVSCGSPGKVENGIVQMEDDKFQSIANFSCNEGYKLLGDKYRECMEDGTWSDSIPTCERSCPDPPEPDFAQIIEIPQYFPVGITITYRCSPGYKYDLFLPPIIQCLDGFTWSKITEFCKKVICGEPERIKNGNVRSTGTDFGSTATYSCNNGFTLIGQSQRKCTADAVWEGSPPVCQ
ncbi:C4b-binding protein alpha chain-like isoform X2 [Rhinoderma darwinii]|uniref:C4b-binding protein alpha chain-like isoform X2 n=1 Tax=Rhinoderma darwinii TaxID=43563 RepID=UPI003F66A879